MENFEMIIIIVPTRKMAPFIPRNTIVMNRCLMLVTLCRRPGDSCDAGYITGPGLKLLDPFDRGIEHLEHNNDPGPGPKTKGKKDKGNPHGIGAHRGLGRLGIIHYPELFTLLPLFHILGPFGLIKPVKKTLVILLCDVIVPREPGKVLLPLEGFLHTTLVLLDLRL
ncbi:MAG: hypothetical protein MZU79_00030 [Anaerotruncus sp.]|nr:hypothetical protein [Anaerotruncus sp.]